MAMSKKSVKVVESGSKSQQMIDLWSGGVELSTIAKMVGTRYQFVNNVVHRYCKKHNVVFTTNKVECESKKSQIITLYFDEHKEIKEIATILKTNKSYVWQIVDDKRQEIK